MTSLQEFRDNVTGAWALMLGRPEGLARLDTSLEGFWRSFALVILLLPLGYLVLLGEPPPVEGAVRVPLTGGRLAIETIAFLTNWFTFPLVLAFLAPLLGLGARYVPFIVARNWAAVIIGAGLAVIDVFHLVGVIPSAAMPLISLVTIGVELRFLYVIARVTLAVSPAVALPVVVFDLLLSLTIWSLFGRLVQGG